MQRTPLATEAQYLLARYVFETLGYRRYEWKCNALNAPSRRAAERYGFVLEGILFRQHMIVKGRNRDTAYFSMLDSEWPARKAAFERWLAPENFDRDGRQKTKLGEGIGSPQRHSGGARRGARSGDRPRRLLNRCAQGLVRVRARPRPGMTAERSGSECTFSSPARPA